MRQWFKNSRHNLVTILMSLIVTIFLIKAVSWLEVLETFHREFSGIVLVQFLVVALAIAFIYGYRWRLLLDREMTHKTSLVSSIISLGGNMFLPVRGGDILRVHYSHLTTGMSHAKLLSRLFVEKIIDILVIVAIGALATIVMSQQNLSTAHSILAVLTASALTAVFVGVIMIKYFGETLLRWLHPLFLLLGKVAFFERHVVHLVHNASSSMTARNMTLPFIVTFIMWLSVYALSYILAARLVGVVVPYTESLFVLFVGTLGLMIPAAPSGVGTFHASVVSAFVILGRSPVEGLLVATIIHLLFFVAFALPAALLCVSWRLSHTIPR